MAEQTGRGRLKIYFGYAAGVGKTYQMLEETRALKAQGVDVVIGFLAARGRPDIVSNAQGLESIPPASVASRSGPMEEMDVEGILRRHPQACAVDELAHSNVAGSPRAKRWEDVRVLLDAGIDVFTTMNVHDLSSLTDQVWQITGLHVHETVPDWVFQQANEVVMVDVTPRALIHRLERGAIFAQEKARGAELIFQEPKLVALRELAIRQTAQALEARKTGEAGQPGSREERLLVHVTAEPSTAMLLRRARRIADYIHASCVAAYVHREREFSEVPLEERQAIERHLRFAESLHIETKVIQDKDRARALVGFAQENGVTQILLCRGADKPRSWFAGLDFTDQVVQRARGLEVTLVAERSRDGRGPVAYPEDEAASLMHGSFVSVLPETSVEDALAEVRRQAANVEMFFYVYAVDSGQHLQGIVSFRDLLAADRSKTVQEIMRRNYAFVFEDADKEEVARLASKQRLLAIPVLDRDGHMLGIVGSADVADVMQQEAGEDIQKIGGMEALDGPYLQVTFAQMVRKRAGWLAILFVGEMLTATAMGYFSDEIARAVVLALFLPLIISSGGNSGSQATTLVIRAMALGELRLRDWWRVVSRELAAGIALGMILGAIGVSRILLWQRVSGAYGPHYLFVALTIGCSLIGVVTFGTIAGSMLPFLLRRCGLDPASASAPFVATLVDVSGLIIYFTVASVILRGTLL